MAKYIQLTQGRVAIVDDEDFKWLSQFSWCYHQSGYAMRGARVNGRNQTYRMHRQIMDAQAGTEIDHINGNRLDNRKSNLRVTDRQQNSFNTRSRKGSLSNYKGVGWFARDGKWRARIMLDRKEIHLGLFDTEHEAAEAYNREAVRLFGQYAKLNQL
ncbi:HNH endonuclease [Cohnella sp. GbtcB17]|uniref:HNH endonuclease n=1 Tax=Cohnella sp. GbtcB17 TaxID=2824762 RepID=UPI0034D6775A